MKQLKIYLLGALLALSTAASYGTSGTPQQPIIDTLIVRDTAYIVLADTSKVDSLIHDFGDKFNIEVNDTANLQDVIKTGGDIFTKFKTGAYAEGVALILALAAMVYYYIKHKKYKTLFNDLSNKK